MAYIVALPQLSSSKSTTTGTEDEDQKACDTQNGRPERERQQRQPRRPFKRDI